MNLKLFSILLLFVMGTTQAQEVKRITIKGKVIVQSDELEGISIINTSTREGTTTDAKGEFAIEAGLNDVLLVHALQFEDFKASISEEVIKSKRMVVYLMEAVNRLDEVLVLPYDLTGYLDKDVDDVRTFNPDMDAIYFGIKKSDEYEFRADYKTRVENIAMHSQSQPIITNGLNVANIIGLFFKKKKKKSNEQIANESLPSKNLLDYYKQDYITSNFKIPEARITKFIAYLEENNIDYSLLEKGKEIEFLEFVNQKSQLFLLTQRD